MLRLFVVDDEAIIRDGIRNVIEQVEDRYFLTGEAADGEMALPQLQELRPDVLITDIRMPFIDGLELCDRVRRTMPWMKIIIISGHDEFEYARKAIRYGVNEYLLKPITKDLLLEALERTAASISKEISELASAKQAAPDKEERYILREHLLNHLIAGDLTAAEAQDRAEQLGIPLNRYREYILACADLSALDRDQIRQLRTLVSRWVEHYQHMVPFFADRNVLSVFLAAEQAGEAEEEMYGILQGLIHEAGRYLNVGLNFGVGLPVNRLSELPMSWNTANLARVKELGGGSQQGLIVSFAADREGRYEGAAPASGADIDLAELDESPSWINSGRLAEQIAYLEADQVEPFIRDYYRIGTDQSVKSILYRYYLTMNLIIVANRVLEKMGSRLSDRYDLVNEPETVFAKISTLEGCLKMSTELMQAFCEMREQSDYRYSKEITDARSFIQKAYADPDLTLQVVAEKVGYSPNHFSAIYSQETGETFISYLTQVRLEAAADLLQNSSLKLQEVAEQVGYHEARYFGYLFKKHYGCPPGEYRLRQPDSDRE